MCSTGEGQQEQSETAITVIFMGRRILIGRFSAPCQIKWNCILVGCWIFIYLFIFLIRRWKQFDKILKDHGCSGCHQILSVNSAFYNNTHIWIILQWINYIEQTKEHSAFIFINNSKKYSDIIKNEDLLFIYYSFFRWKRWTDLLYNEEIKQVYKQAETKIITLFEVIQIYEKIFCVTGFILEFFMFI